MSAIQKTVKIGSVSGNVNIGEIPEYQVNSAINELLNCLASKPFNFDPMRRRAPAEAVIKIKHNNLNSKSNIIRQYLDHSSKIEEAYIEIDTLVTFGKATILRNLYDLYFSALDAAGIDHLLDEVDIIKVRENSDFIIDFIIQKLRNTVFESKNTPSFKETIDLGVNIVVAHAFIECVIMENPNIDT